MGRREFDSMVFGTGRERAHDRGHGREADDIGEIGKTAVKGVVTVATIGVAGAVMGGILGSMK